MSNFTAKARRHGEDRIIAAPDQRDIGDALRCSCVHPITRDQPITEPIEFHPERVRANASVSRRIYALARTAGRLAAAALREIFDESSYDRYLAHTGSTRSVASYRAFLQERETGIAQRPRCC